MFIPAILFSLDNPALCENKLDFKKIEIPNEGFSISMPLNWIEIPFDELRNFSTIITEEHPEITPQNFKYGFQSKFEDNWFELPYVLIKIENVGKIPLNTFSNLSKIKDEIDNKLNQKESSLALQELKFAEMYFDSTNYILWSIFSNETDEFGKVKGLTGGYLTEKGLIGISCYSKESEFSFYLPIFERIINSVNIAENLKYHNPSGYSSKFKNVDWSKVIVAAIIGILLTIFYSYRKQQKSNFLK